MIDKQRVFANFVITADTKTEETTIPERHFIYSRLSHATNAMGFVQLFFLTTRSMFTIPRNSFQTLSAFYLPDVTLQGYTEGLALFDGESTPRMVRIEDAKVDTTNSIKFKYKYSSHHFPINIDYGKNIFDDPLSTAPSINAHYYAIHPHHHPPQNTLQSRTHRHPSMDSQR